jgi:hypothetical protein
MVEQVTGLRTRFSDKEDAILKRLHNKDWSPIEAAYRVHKECGTLRTDVGIIQRKLHLAKDGVIEKRARGKRFVTKEALKWYNDQYGTAFAPNHMLLLSEPAKKGKKGNGNGHKMNSREVIGFTRSKGRNEDRIDYTAMMMRLGQQSAPVLDLFEALMGTAVDEGVTSPKILTHIKLARA